MLEPGIGPGRGASRGLESEKGCILSARGTGIPSFLFYAPEGWCLGGWGAGQNISWRGALPCED